MYSTHNKKESQITHNIISREIKLSKKTKVGMIIITTLKS